ncbi:MAG: chemotaxis protein CheX [Chitinivibrionales bacterium]|nr:chemotaxis protein CheX [Chitinivibrionales bacterium]
MDVSYVNAFLQATTVTFKTLIGIDVSIGDPNLKGKIKMDYGISGSIGLSGKAVGFIALSYPKSLAISIVSKMLSMEIKDIGPEVADAIGEITNIIAGHSKQYLADLNLQISLPNVIIGSDYQIVGFSSIPVIVVPMKCNLGAFFMQISLKTY